MRGSLAMMTQTHSTEHLQSLVVLASKERSTCVEDGSLVMGNLMNAAYAVGVGSCWIHRAREVFDSEEGKALLQKWGIKGDYIGVGHCILGYPADGAVPEAKPRKDDYIVYVSKGMAGIICAALGGGLGAVLRYGISLLPYKGSFPAPYFL